MNIALADYHKIQNHADSNSTFGELLLELMRAEYEQRQENNNRRRLKQANFPFTKTIDELDLSRYDGQISDLFISELASCRFIDEKKNPVMIGNPGRGKTHMAIGIGLKACAGGKSVLFKNAASFRIIGSKRQLCSWQTGETNPESRSVDNR